MEISGLFWHECWKSSIGSGEKKNVCHCMPNSDWVCNWLFACDLLHDQGWRLVIFPLICVSNCLLMNLIHKSNICSCVSCNSQTVLPVPSSWKFFQALVYSLADKYNINYKIFPSSQQPCTQGCILLQKVPWLWDLGLLLIEKCFVKKKKEIVTEHLWFNISLWFNARTPMNESQISSASLFVLI